MTTTPRSFEEMGHPTLHSHAQNRGLGPRGGIEIGPKCCSGHLFVKIFHNVNNLKHSISCVFVLLLLLGFFC